LKTWLRSGARRLLIQCSCRRLSRAS